MQITVAIPTIAGRSAYLRSCLQTCVSQDEEFEILVSDNPGGDARLVAESFDDPRIRYVTPPRYLPMSAHWDFVLAQVRGSLLTFIGDDDGLMPNCIRRVSDLAAHAPGKPIHHAFANYFWPDFVNPRKRNTVTFMHPAGEGQQTVQSLDFLRAVAKGNARYVDGPMVYHNFIPTQLMRDLSVNGVFFRRSSPDLYSALAIAANTPCFISTKEVLTLSGQGAKANGAAVQSGKGHGFLSEAKAQYTPRYGGRSVQMALLDSLIEVAEHFNRRELLAEIDYAAHFAAVIQETRWIAPEARANELRSAYSAASHHGVRAKTIIATAANVIRRLTGSRPSSPRGISYRSGQAISMPLETQTIFDAARTLEQLMIKPGLA